MTRQIPEHRNDPSLATRMREHAEDLLDRSLSAEECGAFACVNERTWKRFETGEVPLKDSIIKAFCYTVALEHLTLVDERRPNTDAVEVLLDVPDDKALTMRNIRDYCKNVWAQFDPAEQRYQEKVGG